MPYRGRKSPRRRGRVLFVDDRGPMRRFIGEALGASSDVTAISGCARAYMRLSTGPPFDLVLVDYGVSPTRTGHGACVELVSRMFHRWPWMPIVIIADRRRVGRLAAELLVSGVRKVLPHGTATAVLARSVARAARRPGARVRSEERRVGKECRSRGAP